MKKKLFALALSAAAALGTVWVAAEQPEAAKYREILNSGTFCIDYKQAGWYNMKQRLAVKDGKREAWEFASGGLFAKLEGPSAKLPKYMYADGMYYLFERSTDLAFVADEEWVSEKTAENRGKRSGTARTPEERAILNLYDMHINLSLPDGLTVFLPHDPYNEKIGSDYVWSILYPNDPYKKYEETENTDPVFVESGQTDTKKKVRLDKPFSEDGKVTGKGVLRNYDKYVATATHPLNGMPMEKTFYVYYEAGVLKEIRVTYQTAEMQEPRILGYMHIESITQEMPENAFLFPTQVYRPEAEHEYEDNAESNAESQNGTMDELLGRIGSQK